MRSHSMVEQFNESCAFERNLASLRQENDPLTEDKGKGGLPRKRLWHRIVVTIVAALMAFGAGGTRMKSKTAGTFAPAVLTRIFLAPVEFQIAS